MFSASIVLSLAACLVPVLGHPTTGPRAISANAHTAFNCGTEPSAEFLSTVSEMAVAEKSKSEIGIAAIAATITVQTYVHVVASSTSSSGGYISASQITKQMAYMNSAYAAYGFQFNLVNTSYTVNTNWANDGAELAMKKSLRRGTYKDLNLYFQLNVGGADSGLLGVSRPSPTMNSC
jgi:hypothetical protein